MTARLRSSSIGASIDGDRLLELYRHAVVRRAAQQVHPVGQLPRVHPDRERRRADGLRNRTASPQAALTCLNVPPKPVVAGGNRLRVVVVVPALVVMPAGRETRTVADVHVAGVGELVLVVHVAEHGVRHPGVNALQHVLFVDGRIDAVLAEHPDRHHRHLLGHRRRTVPAHLAQLPAPDGHGIGARQPRGLQEAVRVQPHLQLPELGFVWRRRDRRRGRAIVMPAKPAVHDELLA